MTPARWCCLGLIVLGLVLLLAEVDSYKKSYAQDMRNKESGRVTDYYAMTFGRWAMATYLWRWGVGCVVIGVIGMVVLEVAGKSRKKAEP